MSRGRALNTFVPNEKVNIFSLLLQNEELSLSEMNELQFVKIKKLPLISHFRVDQTLSPLLLLVGARRISSLVFCLSHITSLINYSSHHHTLHLTYEAERIEPPPSWHPFRDSEKLMKKIRQLFELHSHSHWILKSFNLFRFFISWNSRWMREPHESAVCCWLEIECAKIFLFSAVTNIFLDSRVFSIASRHFFCFASFSVA